MPTTGDEWTTDTLRVYLLREVENANAQVQQQFVDLNVLLDERYGTQSKALDKAFVASETAMRTALEAAEKAVQAALTAAKEAVTKSEVAAEKRFESVNEFRGQLQDMIETLVSKIEVDAKFRSVADKADGTIERFERQNTKSDERIGALETRVATDVGGLEKRLSDRLVAIEVAAATITVLKSQMYTVFGVLLTAIGVSLALILALNGPG